MKKEDIRKELDEIKQDIEEIKSVLFFSGIANERLSIVYKILVGEEISTELKNLTERFDKLMEYLGLAIERNYDTKLKVHKLRRKFWPKWLTV